MRRSRFTDEQIIGVLSQRRTRGSADGRGSPPPSDMLSS